MFTGVLSAIVKLCDHEFHSTNLFFQGKCHIGVSRVKNLSTSVKKLFCVMAAINGSTGPVTVEYHEKPTGTQLNLV